MGNAVKDSIHSGIVKRDDLFITSKLANDGHKREDVRPALLKSLKVYILIIKYIQINR